MDRELLLVTFIIVCKYGDTCGVCLFGIFYNFFRIKMVIVEKSFPRGGTSNGAKKEIKENIVSHYYFARICLGNIIETH